MSNRYSQGETSMIYVASLLGFLGLFMAWLANRRNKDLTEQVERVNSRVYHLRQALEEAQEKANQEHMALKYEILQLKGDLKITPEMQIGEIISIHPQAQQLLAGFHIGGCSSCSVDNTQSLNEAVSQNGRAIEPILMALNTLINESNGQPTPPQKPLKVPNVQLQI